VAILAITACNVRTVRGSGDLITETRDVSGFDSISLSGSGEVILAIIGQQKSPDDVERPAQPQLPEPLTEQELNILALIVGGKTYQQIADELVITLGTVKWHVHNILQKLGINNRTQATIRAQELGLL
jgi:DNA-binding NarL/FixJ family response regulator